ncbi:hypothetical protein DFH11DRAFT_1544505 [Phellopilus nigrolimitatus]|nr:hypothetical protein DFH11DRAFT_1544505 [Phellopilus nigrolimitatus]
MHTGGPRKILQHLRLLQINNRHSQLPPPKPRKILQHRRLLQINNRHSQLPPPKPRKILQLLRLLQINKPTFPPPKPCKILQLLRLLQINKHLFLRILSLHSERNECANDGFRFTGMAAWQSLHLRATRQSLHLRDAVSRRSRVGKSRAATETINGCEERLLACGRRNGIAGGQGKCMTSSQGWRSPQNHHNKAKKAAVTSAAGQKWCRQFFEPWRECRLRARAESGEALRKAGTSGAAVSASRAPPKPTVGGGDNYRAGKAYQRRAMLPKIDARARPRA